MLSDGGWALLGAYVPTVPEVLIVVGMPCLGALAFMALGSKLLVPASEHEAVPVAPAAAELDFDPQAV